MVGHVKEAQMKREQLFEEADTLGSNCRRREKERIFLLAVSKL